MTNFEIIAGECALRGIDEEVGTYQFWAKQGRKIKRGEKALFETRIWKPSKNKQQEQENDTEEDKEMKRRGFYLCRAYFFSESQLLDSEES